MRLPCLLAVAAALSCSSSSTGAPDSPLAIDGATAADGALPDAKGSVDAPGSGGVDAALPDALALADSGTAPVVPEPGTNPLPQFWPDDEPNDTPEQAVRIGTGIGQIGPYVDRGHIGGADRADYFVFRTGDSSDITWIAGACWDAQLDVNLLDFTLYKVIDGQPLIPISSANSQGKTCETQLPFSIPLERNTKYLFAVFHVEGEADYTA